MFSSLSGVDLKSGLLHVIIFNYSSFFCYQSIKNDPVFDHPVCAVTTPNRQEFASEHLTPN